MDGEEIGDPLDMEECNVGFDTDGPLEQFVKGTLNEESKTLLQRKYPHLGDELLILKTSEVKKYYSNLLKVTHENILAPVAWFEVSGTSYSCVCFESYSVRFGELEDLFTDEKNGTWAMSKMLSSFVFKTAKVFQFLHKMSFYHGALTMEKIYASRISNQFVVKLSGLQGLVGDESARTANCGGDWRDLAALIEGTFVKHEKTPNKCIENYILKLKQGNGKFAFIHPLWLSLECKQGLIIHMDEIETNATHQWYDLKDNNLKNLVKLSFPRMSLGDIFRFLRNKMPHPNYPPGYEKYRKNFKLLLEDIEENNPNIWTDMMEATNIIAKLDESKEAKFRAWMRQLQLNEMANLTV